MFLCNSLTPQFSVQLQLHGFSEWMVQVQSGISNIFIRTDYTMHAIRFEKKVQWTCRKCEYWIFLFYLTCFRAHLPNVINEFWSSFASIHCPVHATLSFLLLLIFCEKLLILSLVLRFSQKKIPEWHNLVFTFEADSKCVCVPHLYASHSFHLHVNPFCYLINPE